MLANKAEEVIAELGTLRQEHPQKAVVEACHRNLGNRTTHLRYAEALAVEPNLNQSAGSPLLTIQTRRPRYQEGERDKVVTE